MKWNAKEMSYAAQWKITRKLEGWIPLKDKIRVQTTTTTKPFVPSIWGRLHEPKENYARSGTWISFLHSYWLKDKISHMENGNSNFQLLLTMTSRLKDY